MDEYGNDSARRQTVTPESLRTVDIVVHGLSPRDVFAADSSGRLRDARADAVDRLVTMLATGRTREGAEVAPEVWVAFLKNPAPEIRLRAQRAMAHARRPAPPPADEPAWKRIVRALTDSRSRS